MLEKMENVKLQNQNIILQNKLLELEKREKRITYKPVTDRNMLQGLYSRNVLDLARSWA